MSSIFYRKRLSPRFMSSIFGSRHVVTRSIALNEQAVIDKLTENNKKRVWASRRTWEDEQHYLVHVQGIGGNTTPCTLAVKKFQSMNPALQVDNNVKYRYNSEMIMLASNSHENIIKVIDLIEREDAIMLVYEYPVNGSLASWLHQPMDAGQQLSWPQRKLIADGVAQGLCQLHHGCNKPIVHHNISSCNILITDKFKAVITAFDAARMNMAGLGQPLPITADLSPGNYGYSAPEYGNTASPMTEKVDTYSFGVMLLEIVTGRDANGDGPDGHLAIWARNFTELMAKKLEKFENAVHCTAVDPQQRPSMKMARERLRGRGPFHGLLSFLM